jgi:type II secretory pathway predicted ATPase ExeA
VKSKPGSGPGFLTEASTANISEIQMYENFYRLTASPFQITPDSDFFYVTSKHENALAYLRYGLIQKAGFTLLTGEIGTGKTTVVLYFLRRYCRKMKTALVSNTNISADQLLILILKKFGLSAEGTEKSEQLEMLNQFLLKNHSKNLRTLLVIDEAQNLSLESLEEIRMLSNFQHNGNLLLQIVLVGQPEFRARLKSPRLANISQRISASYHLTALSYSESYRYIAYRLKKAGGSPGLFTPEAKNLIYKTAAGIPRTINLLADAALVYGFAEELQTINVEIVEKAVKDKDGLGIDFDSEYADSVLCAPMATVETDNDAFHRLQKLEVDLDNLQNQVNRQNKESDRKLKLFKDALAKKLRSLILQERARTDNRIKNYQKLIRQKKAAGIDPVEENISKVILMNRNKE